MRPRMLEVSAFWLFWRHGCWPALDQLHVDRAEDEWDHSPLVTPYALGWAAGHRCLDKKNSESANPFLAKTEECRQWNEGFAFACRYSR